MQKRRVISDSGRQNVAGETGRRYGKAHWARARESSSLDARLDVELCTVIDRNGRRRSPSSLHSRFSCNSVADRQLAHDKYVSEFHKFVCPANCYSRPDRL